VHRGTPAQATILTIDKTGISVQENYGQAQLRLRVEPPDGAEAYETSVRRLIDRFDIPAYPPGGRVSVLIDPVDPLKVALASPRPTAAATRLAGNNGSMSGRPSAGAAGRAKEAVMASREYKCEDCGCEFVELMPEVEDSPLACPECGGLDIQRLDERTTDAA